MKVRVVYDDVRNVCNNVNKRSNDLFDQINNLSNILDDLSNVWKGDDGDAFYRYSKNIVDQFKIIPEVYQEFINKIDILNEDYKEIDDRCSQLLESSLSKTETVNIRSYNNTYYEPVIPVFEDEIISSAHTGYIESENAFTFDERYENNEWGY